MNLNTVNIELSFTIEDFEKYLSIIHPTGGTRTSYMRVLKYMNFKNIFSSYSVTEIENNFIESMKSQKFIDFINKSPSYDKKGFVKATKNKVIEFFEVLENNKSIIETDTRLDKKDFFNIHRKIEKRVINRKTIFISSRYIKEKIKANNKYFCQINDKDKCRYFLDKNTKNYIEVHHIIPLSLQEKFWKEGINLDVAQNMICLCALHHRQIHYGNKKAFNEVFEKIWKIKGDELRNISPTITIEEIKSYY